MTEPFLRLEWPVMSAYQWQDWLDPRGEPVPIPTDGLKGLDSCSAVERTWNSLNPPAGDKVQVGPVIGATLDAKRIKTYRPMSRDYATLFRTFADLDHTNQDDITGFVMAYGLLGLEPQDQIVTVTHGRGSDRHHFAHGESHLDWAWEICQMREALDLSRSQTPDEVKRDRAAFHAVGLEPPHRNRRERLNWLCNRHLQFVQARIGFEGGTAPQLTFTPLTLLAAMWLQLSLAVAGSKEYRSCKFCQRLFEISTDQTGFRRHREFCSQSCKTKDYRRRKRLTVQLKKQGKTVSQIADVLNTEKATVRKWISASRTQKREKS